MANWHYSVNGRQAGPVTQEEIMSKFQKGDINEDTLVWNGALGATWKRYSEVSELQQPDIPPPLPPSAITDVWIWLLAIVPALGYFVENALSTTEGDPPVVLLAYCVVNGTLGYFDERAIKQSGRRDRSTSFWAAALLVPVYLFSRNRRLRRNQFPLATWFAAVAFAVYAMNGSLNPLLALGPTSCDAYASVAKVKELFPRIPLNVSKLDAKEVRNPRETSATPTIRTCAAEIVSPTGNIYDAEYTIERRDTDYYIMLRLK
ncbi:Hypothetical protein NGAL_HAMBI1146_58800 [Neorhizobium galegae bv. officinalis]|nr:Hypothetical protein NGAL_HAMBI1146_58800 [Neorhizobium galegae bv. officinalis]